MGLRIGSAFRCSDAVYAFDALERFARAGFAVDDVDFGRFGVGTEERERVRREYMYPGASDADLWIFMYHAFELGLDPRSGELRVRIERIVGSDGISFSQGVLVASIETIRKLAARSGQYGGTLSIENIEEAGELVACRARVFAALIGAFRQHSSLILAPMPDSPLMERLEGRWRVGNVSSFKQLLRPTL